MAKKKKVKRKSTPSEKQPGFEQSLAELETIVAQLESGELGLGDALARYERGIARLKQCHAQLAEASRKIELLSGVDAAGNPITEPMGNSGETKRGARSRKRKTGGVDDGGTLF